MRLVQLGSKKARGVAAASSFAMAGLAGALYLVSGFASGCSSGEGQGTSSDTKTASGYVPTGAATMPPTAPGVGAADATVQDTSIPPLQDSSPGMDSAVVDSAAPKDTGAPDAGPG